jgi:hypothetical protein
MAILCQFLYAVFGTIKHLFTGYLDKAMYAFPLDTNY